MDSKELLKLLVKIDDSLVVIADRKTGRIKEAYFNNEELCSNGSFAFNEFIDIFKDKFKISIKGDDYHLFDELNNVFNKETFHFPMIFRNAEDKPIKLLFKGSRIGDDVLIYVTKQVDDDSGVDDLTKCVTRTKFDAEIKKAMDEKSEFLLVLIDIDNFKEFNERYGHVLGDIALIEISVKLNDLVGTNGWVCRVGGDKFLLYYKIQDDYDICHEFLTNTHKSLVNEINSVLNVDTLLTFTFGTCQFPSDGNNYDTLLKKAKKALIRGKKKARNCFIMYLVEKCGPITSLDEGLLETFDTNIESNSNNSVITGILEIVNRNNTFEMNIEDSLELIGTYFLLDRISVIETSDNDDNILSNNKTWYNPKSKKFLADDDVVKKYGDNMGDWRELLGDSNLLKIDDIYAMPEIKIYNELIDRHVQAIIATELKFNGKIFGIILFEMTNIARVWMSNDISSLILIARILSIKYYKEYENRQFNQKLFFDRLTGFYNYNKWILEVSDYISNHRNEEYSICDVAIYEYSNLFSMIGKKKMDEIILYLASNIRLVADDALYCRSQDDTFTFFMPHSNLDSMKRKFLKLTTISSEIKMDVSSNLIFTLGVFVNDGKTDIDTSVENASLARKFATPLNNVIVYDNDMRLKERANLELALHIESALKNDEFLLYLQPKISTTGEKLLGAEALSRWLYNGEKLIFPNEFIPIFEKNGYIIKLDYSVFENVCRFIRKCIDDNKKIIPISVNVSRAVGNFNDYIDHIEQIRKKYDVPPDLIEVEITEGMYTEHEEEIKKFIDNLHKYGYKVSMDDFGSGYSNISSLSQLNFDTIKLDKSFINDINNDKETKILSFIIKLVKSLNMTVLCEGVETKEYADFLKKVGCDIIQGYLYDKPIKYDDFEKKYL